MFEQGYPNTHPEEKKKCSVYMLLYLNVMCNEKKKLSHGLKNMLVLTRHPTMETENT